MVQPAIAATLVNPVPQAAPAYLRRRGSLDLDFEFPVRRYKEISPKVLEYYQGDHSAFPLGESRNTHLSTIRNYKPNHPPNRKPSQLDPEPRYYDPDGTLQAPTGIPRRHCSCRYQLEKFIRKCQQVWRRRTQKE